MRTTRFTVLLLALTAAIALVVAGCTTSTETKSPSPEQRTTSPSTSPAPTADKGGHDEGHGHKPGAHGGHIVSLGSDSYHVEAIVTKEGQLRLYTLGNDETKVIDIEAQPLTAYVKPEGSSDSVSIEVKPDPQPGDGERKSSVFVGQLPEGSIGKSVDVTIPNITIAGERFRLNFSTHVEDVHGTEEMPDAAKGAEARELYLTPGGLYTAADIEANGNVTAAQKFKGAMASHDLKPMAGDKICPITLTKANPKFSWVVGGKTYEFCCPPCVDEFVALAKTNPEEIKEPEEYVKEAADAAESP